MSALEKTQTSAALELVPNPMIHYLALLAYETAKNNVNSSHIQTPVPSHSEALFVGSARPNQQRDTGAHDSGFRKQRSA
mgnify:CR=1 FL=1